MKNLFYLLFLFFTQIAFAQSIVPESFGDATQLKNVEIGHIFAQVYMPFTLKKNVMFDSVLTVENHRHLLANLEKGKDYRIDTLVVETHPPKAEYAFEVINDTTFTNTKTIIKHQLELIEPSSEYENQIITERKLVLRRREIPYFFVLKRRRDCINVLKNRPDATAIGYALIEIPAKYIDVQKRVFQKDGIWWAETIADTIELKDEILSFDSKLVDKVTLTPAVLDTFHVIHFNSIPQNVTYSQIRNHVMDKKGYISEWRELICVQCYDRPLYPIIDIQKSLKAKGYNVPIDDVFGDSTKAALIQFQKDNNLPIGELEVKTLKLLGIKL